MWTFILLILFIIIFLTFRSKYSQIYHSNAYYVNVIFENKKYIVQMHLQISYKIILKTNINNILNNMNKRNKNIKNINKINNFQLMRLGN